MNLVLREKRLNGARYYTVMPDFGLGLWNSREKWDAMSAWCTEHFGPAPNNRWATPNDRWFAVDSAYWFRDPRDQTLFVLRWS